MSGLKEDVNSRAFEGLFWTVGQWSLALLTRALERMNETEVEWSGNGADRQKRQADAKDHENQRFNSQQQHKILGSSSILGVLSIFSACCWACAIDKILLFRQPTFFVPKHACLYSSLEA